ncbi:hypothetical protein MNB_SM-5-1493 [hydrothermal vent metagenome]|uniref:Hemerythrin-like domain-containing protein n=1 Tax=hydrothermal vent metagenome TaxID=652676 RepID=A0A1W1BGJ7_9ZZZZ
MLQKFFNFFKFKKGVPFDPKLIAKFNHDHKKLVTIAMQIQEQIDGKHSNALIRSLLKSLRSEIYKHFQEEEETLYKYLTILYKNDTERKELVQGFNDSMYAIKDGVESFMNKYTQKEANYGREFAEEFGEIVKALGTRIETEEKKLYSLYNEKIETIDEKEIRDVK